MWRGRGGERMGGERSFPAEAARRALVRHTGLAQAQALDIRQTVERLGCVQMDPMQVVAPAHLLTLRLRRGRTTEPMLSRALGAGQLIEAFLHQRCLLSASDIDAAVPHFLSHRARRQIAARGLEETARRVLTEIRERGPLLAREVESSHRVASYWDPDQTAMKATTMALDILHEEGRVLVAGRVRGERRYALPEQVMQNWEDAFADPERAARTALEHYGRTMGLFRLSHPFIGWQTHDGKSRRRMREAMLDRGEWLAVRIDGQTGYVVTRGFLELLEAGEAVRGVRVLAPLDNLLWDRLRLEGVFGFRYRWEAYTPRERRTVGPYGMPVLCDGRMVGEVDAQVVRGEGLRARLILRVPLGPAQERRVERHLAALARDIGTVRAGAGDGAAALPE